MIFWLASIFGGAWVFWCLLQLLLAGYAASIFNRQLSPLLSNSSPKVQGRAAIFLSVRGSDPSFRDCIESLLAQDYDDFEIHVIVDSSTDPAWPIVKTFQRDVTDGKLNVHELSTPQMTCGLKCSALNYGVSKVGSAVRYFAFVDSDVVVHSTWLSELLSPLADEAIGVTTGNQWFEPDSSRLGSLLRSVWHAGAIVPTIIYANPWAGSIGMRRADFEVAGLAEYWRSSIVDDGPVREAFEAIGKRIELVSSVTLINRESCSASFTAKYVRRMLTWSKLYEGTYGRTAIHALITGVLLLGTILITLASIVARVSGISDISEAGIAASIGLMAILAGMVVTYVGYLMVRTPIKRMHASRGSDLQTIGPMRAVALLVLMPVTQVLYVYSLVSALFAKQVRWRDATYEINSKSDVRLLSYEPFLREEDSGSSII